MAKVRAKSPRLRIAFGLSASPAEGKQGLFGLVFDYPRGVSSKKKSPPKKTAAPAKRPKGVPPEAVFDAAENEWQVGAKKGKKLLGDWTWWRPDGTLCARSSFNDQGELHGIARRYHSDGSISMESRYVHGVRWGKTRHTRSRRGDSPEDVHMAEFPDHVFEVAMAYSAGDNLVQSATNKFAVKKPPQVENGWFDKFAKEIPKYEAGTAFMVLGTITDIAKQRFEVPVLFYDGPAHEDYSILRFSFHPPGSYTSKKPTWQDPEYGTAVSLKEASKKLLLAVDAFDLLAASGKAPPDAGFKIEIEKNGIAIREVAPKHAAAKAGLRVGDVIAKMNGKRIKTPGDYMAGRGELAQSRRIVLGIVRGKKKLDVELVTK
jgi:hypothetical protein